MQSIIHKTEKIKTNLYTLKQQYLFINYYLTGKLPHHTD